MLAKVLFVVLCCFLILCFCFTRDNSLNDKEEFQELEILYPPTYKVKELKSIFFKE